MSKAAVIKDVQSSGDTRAVAIDRVGIRGLRLPMLFCESTSPRPTVGEWNADTNLPAGVRGTHMSRLVRVLHDYSDELNFTNFCAIPDELRQRLSASACYLSVSFVCFMEKTAPISNEKGFLDSQTAFIAYLNGDEARYLMQITVPVTSLCPCSKVISKYGAHNQRSHVTLTIEADKAAHVRDLIALAEAGASSELYSVLKRADERHVTERAYDNPKFVEDIVRDLAVALQREAGVYNYRVEAENFESIHNHSAYAMIESDNFPIFLLR